MGSNGSDSQEKKPESPPSMDTRRMRGLSQRLQRPLSVESNVPDPMANRMQTKVVQPTPEPPVATPAKPLVGEFDTRQMAAAPTSPSKHAEGLLSEGIQLQNRYKILGVIGVGGMGAVYKAQDLRFAQVMRLCAVKEMVNTATDPQVRQMITRNFEREASILATLSHPAIPQVYDFFTEGARSYLVLEFIPGKDLEAYLAEVEGFVPEALVTDWAIQLCDVLSYLHNHKPRPIIFRDLKPSNIMLDDHLRIRLVDFGIAKLFHSGEKGTMIGTEGYSPPEQYRGIAEPRGDIYALGATLHHLLSKQDPRMEPPFSFQERPIHHTNPTVSRELVDIISRSLEYDINKRWGSAEELKRELSGLMGVKVAPTGVRGETAAFNSPDAGVVKPLWRFACEDEIRGAITVHGGVAYVPSYDHNIYALNTENGKFMWKYPAEGGIVSKPLLMDNALVFGSVDKVVYAVDSKTGRLLWSAPTKGRIFSSPYHEFGHIFIGADDRNLYAIHGATGRIAWTYATEGEVRTQPVVAEGLIIFACQAGVVYALSLNREAKWRFRSRKGILSSPVVNKGLVFVGALDWHLYALDLRSGWAAWKYRSGGAVASTVAVWENLVFFGSADGYVYALDAEEGRVVWRYQVGQQVSGSPAVAGESVYIGAINGALYHLDARTGALKWQYKTDGPIFAAPTIAEDVLYFGSADRYVYAIPV